jgi:hypothetical protein
VRGALAARKESRETAALEAIDREEKEGIEEAT